MSQVELVDAYLEGQISRRRFIRGLTMLGMSAGTAGLYAATISRDTKSVFGDTVLGGYRCVSGEAVLYVTSPGELGPESYYYVCTEMYYETTTTTSTSTTVVTTVPEPTTTTTPPTTTTAPPTTTSTTTSTTSTTTTTVDPLAGGLPPTE